jgi:O-antigen/teichoic acid export membrane protein
MKLQIPFISSFSSSSKDFLKDSSLLFITNILNAVFNYSLVIFVSNRLLPGNYSLWTAITGLVAILLTLSTGIMTEFNKNASRIAKHSTPEAFRFYEYFVSKVSKVLSYGLILIPLFAYIMMWILGNNEFWLLCLVIFNVYLQIVLGLNNNFVMSLLKIKEFMILSLVVTVAKFVATIGFIYLHLEVFALPIGLLFSEIAGLVLGVYFLKRIKAGQEDEENTKSADYKIFDHLVGMLKTVVYLFFLATFLNAGPIIAEKIFDKDLLRDKDILAVLFNFGQIIHFGAIAFLSGLITHASRSNNKKIFYSAFVIVTGLSLGIGMIFTIFGSFMMRLFGRAQYIDQLPLILWYSVFILFYNVIFLCTQYLIIKNRYRSLLVLPLINILLILSLVYVTKTTLLFGNSVQNFITISIFFGFVCALYLVLSVVFDKKIGQDVDSAL